VGSRGRRLEPKHCAKNICLLHISVQKTDVFCTGFEPFSTLLEWSPQIPKTLLVASCSHDRTLVGCQQFDEKQRWIELSIPGAETGVVLFTPDGQENRIGTFVNTSWEVDNIQKTYDDLVARAVEFAGPPQKQPWGTFAIMKDSEGNQIVLSSR